MRRELRYVLVADGSSDECLRHPIDWLLRENGVRDAEGRWADLRTVPNIGPGLVERLGVALELYPADVVFVHRDAETKPLTQRLEEIEGAVASVGHRVPHVCVVPIRMTEAWLLHDEAAIRKAADKPNGRAMLHIPPVKRLEEIADPKAVLREALLMASETRGARLKRKRSEFGLMRRRVALRITNYAPLRVLQAFSQLEYDLQQVLASM